MDIKDLEGKKLSDLRVIAIAAGIEKAETLKKSEIIGQLSNLSVGNEAPTTDKVKPTPKAKTPIKKITTPVANEELNTPEVPMNSSEISSEEAKPILRKKTYLKEKPRTQEVVSEVNKEEKTVISSENTAPEVVQPVRNKPNPHRDRVKHTKYGYAQTTEVRT